MTVATYSQIVCDDEGCVGGSVDEPISHSQFLTVVTQVLFFLFFIHISHHPRGIRSKASSVENNDCQRK